MNITHVVEHLPTGGLERIVVDLVREQSDRGHRCQVVCLHDRGRLADELAAVGVPVHACGKRIGIDLPALWRLRGHLRRHATRILHTHNNTAHYVALTAATGMSFERVINTRHGMGSNDPANRRERRYAMTMHRTDAVVTVCESARESFIERGLVPADKLRVVLNGIHTAKFASASDAARLRTLATLGLPSATRVIGSVGRLNQAKDQRTLLEAFAVLRRHGVDAALLILGEGSLRGQLEQRIEALGVADRAFLLGDRDDVAEWMPAFDVFALSSITEGYSVALLEACASALPIVATRVGGNAEIVRDGVNGTLVPPRDAGALAEALASLLVSPGRAHAFGMAGQAWVRAHGSVAAMADGYEKVYVG